MRVITGSARGRRLQTLDGDHVRPTTDRVKEAIFSVIQFDIEAREVLDLFAGSGQLGIEALSRGAKSAVFIDNSMQSLEVIRDNLRTTGFTDKGTVIKTDALMFLKAGKQKFDILFLDPPYNTTILCEALEIAHNVMNEAGIIVCEHPFSMEIPSFSGDIPLKKTYRYSKTAVSVYRK